MLKCTHQNPVWFINHRFIFKPPQGNLPPSFFLPCGKCKECRLARASDWATRIELEARGHERKCFLTLTQSTSNLEYNIYEKSDADALKDEAEFMGISPAEQEDKLSSRVPSVKVGTLQKFVKRLRKYNGSHPSEGFLRVYYGCGEYGSIKGRPHYHMMCLGYCPSDLEYFGKSKKGFDIYRSPSLEKIWKRGFVFVGTECDDSKAAGYVARYNMKKAGLNTKARKQGGRDPEFQLFSKAIPLYMNGKPVFELEDDGYKVVAGKQITVGIGGNWICNNIQTYLVGHLRDSQNPQIIKRIPKSLHNAMMKVSPNSVHDVKLEQWLNVFNKKSEFSWENPLALSDDLVYSDNQIARDTLLKVREAQEFSLSLLQRNLETDYTEYDNYED